MFTAFRQVGADQSAYHGAHRAVLLPGHLFQQGQFRPRQSHPIGYGQSLPPHSTLYYDVLFNGNDVPHPVRLGAGPVTGPAPAVRSQVGLVHDHQVITPLAPIASVGVLTIPRWSVAHACTLP
jgi:hypothetical protein